MMVESTDSLKIDLSIILPTLNEVESVSVTLSVLEDLLQGVAFELIVVDDDSTDATAEEATATAQAHHQNTTAMFSLLRAGPRPADERWVGKNWACTCAMQGVQSEWV